MNYNHADEASKYKLFTLNFIGPIRLWFNALSDGSIKPWSEFCERFIAHFTARKRKLVIVSTLSGITQGKMESLWSYIDRFIEVGLEVEGAI